MDKLETRGEWRVVGKACTRGLLIHQPHHQRLVARLLHHSALHARVSGDLRSQVEGGVDPVVGGYEPLAPVLAEDGVETLHLQLLLDQLARRAERLPIDRGDMRHMGRNCEGVLLMRHRTRLGGRASSRGHGCGDACCDAALHRARRRLARHALGRPGRGGRRASATLGGFGCASVATKGNPLGQVHVIRE